MKFSASFLKLLTITSFMATLIAFNPSASADPPYGTIVLKSGKMIALYRKDHRSVVVARFTRNGRMIGGCVRESRAAWQARKAYMQAQAKWRAGYVPRKWPCQGNV